MHILGIAKKQVKSYLNKRVKNNTVLELDLSNYKILNKPMSPMEKLFDFKKHGIYYLDIVDAIMQATEDTKVVGLIMHITKEVSQLLFTQRIELRNAIIKFRSAGKIAICYCYSFQDSIGSYHLASSFDRIFMSQGGLLIATGIHSAHPFLKKLLSKLDVQAHAFQREEYKTAANMFTQEKFTDAHKEITEKITSSIMQQIIEDVATDRNVKEGEVQSWFDMGVMTAAEALERRVIDGIAYREEAYNELLRLIGLQSKKQAHFLYFDVYLGLKGHPYAKSSRNTIAIIYAIGNIHLGESQNDKSIGSDSLSRAIRNAADDDKVKAILIRIDSRGGDATASDIIAHEIDLAKQRKPVFVSMGQVAASGGYYIASAADKIIASPGTITGSIGVVAMKFNASSFLNKKLGITFDQVVTNKQSTLFSTINGLNEEGEATMNKIADSVYETFTERVARTRNLSNIKELAKGKIYTGIQAKEIGLVDELGGLYDAVELLKSCIGIPQNEKITLKEYPPKLSILGHLLQPKPLNTLEQDKLGTPRRSGGGMGPMMSVSKGIKLCNTISNTVSSIIPFNAKMNHDGSIIANPSLYCDYISKI